MIFHGSTRILIYISMCSIGLSLHSTHAVGSGNGSARHRLLQHLLDNYPLDGKHVIPRQSSHEAVSVRLSINVVNVLHVNQQKETVTIRVYNQYMWRDDFLSWDSHHYEDVDILLLPTKQLWVPDVVVNSIESEECSLDDKAIVYSTGTVVWTPSCVQEIGCKVDPLYFPFDKHQCKYKLGSWSYSNKSLILENMGVQHTKPQIQPEWSLYSINAQLEHINYYNETYTVLVIYFWIHHHAPLFAFLLIFPAVLLSVMTSVVFLLPTDSENKINVAMSIFLSFMVLLHILMDSTPKSSVTVPYLGYYFCLNSLLIAMSVFSATIVSNINAKAATEHMMQPQSKKRLTVMAKLLLVDYPSVTMVTPQDPVTKPSVEAAGNKNVDDGNNQNMKSWMLLATVVDRFLFLLYVVANGIMIVAIFVKYADTTGSQGTG